MSILFLASLPRSSGLGVADTLYRSIDVQDRPVVMTGHVHLAAALSGLSLNQYQSPLHLYDAREALIRCLLSLHRMPVSLDTFQCIAHYYLSGNDACLNVERFSAMLAELNPLIIDPSFSHAISPGLLRHLPDPGVECNLLVTWRNPIDFSLDLMQGVYGFDVCLQWMLANPSLSFPLDPLMLWLDYVRSFIEIIRQPPPVFAHLIHVQREILSPDALAALCTKLSGSFRPSLRLSSVTDATLLFRECPFSGDPSHLIQTPPLSPLEISPQELSRFSNRDQVIHDVLEMARTIGYVVSG